jgi:hypothetical protein
MRTAIAVATLWLAAITLPQVSAAQTAACAGLSDATEIVDCVDRIMRGESSQGISTMEVATENWSRAMDMEMWSLGTDHALVRILSPRKDAGTATLKAGNEIWNYLPRVDRTIKIPASLMSASWMGSHFTNDDLVKESRLIEDYEITLSYEGDRDGVDVWEFDLIPRPEAPVVWGRIAYQVRKSDTMPVYARYYDEDGELIRTMTFFDYRHLGGRLVPAAMRVVPEDKPAEFTEVRYSELEFDVGLDEEFFSLRRLRDTR